MLKPYGAICIAVSCDQPFIFRPQCAHEEVQRISWFVNHIQQIKKTVTTRRNLCLIKQDGRITPAFPKEVPMGRAV
jgi:hypothetical protein